MANQITTYKKIKTVRDALKTVAKEMQTAVNSLPSASYKTKGGAILSTHATSVAKVFNSAEAKLTDAHRAANALGGIKSNPKVTNITYKISKCSGNSDIYINDSDALASVNALGTCITKLQTLYDNIQTCYNEINNVKVTEQLISSLTIIDTLFPIFGMTKAALILYVKNVGTTNLKQAQSDVSKIYKYCENLKAQLIASVTDFAKCEETVKRRTYDDLLNTTSQITEDSKTSSKEIKEKISALEAKQKEYVVLYGVESQAIKDEIARLKKLYGTEHISLQPNFEGHSMKQTDYKLPQKGSNWGCCCTAYSIGLSIIEGKYYNPEKHSNNGSCTWVENGKYGYRIGAYKNGANYSSIYNSLQKGMPTLLHYYYTSSNGRQSQHWVVINGIREGADPDNLTYKDFICIDPWDGKEKSLADLASSYKKFSISGTKTYY